MQVSKLLSKLLRYHFLHLHTTNVDITKTIAFPGRSVKSTICEKIFLVWQFGLTHTLLHFSRYLDRCVLSCSCSYTIYNLSGINVTGLLGSGNDKQFVCRLQ